MKAIKDSDFNFWLCLIVLAVIAVFVTSDRWAVLLFLAAIFAMLFEISDRLRELCRIQATIAEKHGRDEG